MGQTLAVRSDKWYPQPGRVMQDLESWARLVTVMRQLPHWFLVAAAPTPPGHHAFLGHASQMVAESCLVK
jgi:hypothetical protein